MSKQGWEIPVVAFVVQTSVNNKWPQSDVKSVLGLMVEYGADLNRDQDIMSTVAMKCNAKLFQTFRELGANASAADKSGDNLTKWAQKLCKDRICTNATCPEEYIGQPVSQAIANLAQQ